MYNSFVTPWTTALQAPLSMGFPKQEYWSGLPLPFPGDLRNPGIKPASLAFAGRLSLSHQGSPAFKIVLCKSKEHLAFFTCLFFPPAHSLTWKLIPHFCKLFNFFFSFLNFGWIGSSLWHEGFLYLWLTGFSSYRVWALDCEGSVVAMQGFL